MKLYESISPCGLNCSDCEMFTNYNGKDPRKMKPIIMLFLPFLCLIGIFSKKTKAKVRVVKKILKIPPSRRICRGCRNEKGMIPIINSNKTCSIYSCTQTKGFHNCSECEDFPCKLLYPKAKLADLIPHNIKLTNCCLIKKHGLEEWKNNYSEQVKEDYFKEDLPFKI